MRKAGAVLVLAALAVVAGGCGGSEGNEDAEAQAVISRLKSLKPGEILIQGQRKEKFSGPYTLRKGGYVLRFQRMGDEGRVTLSLESRKRSRQQPYELVLSDFDRQAARRNVTLTGRVYVHVRSSADGYLVRLTPRRPGR
jgi:hypothetical protein